MFFERSIRSTRSRSLPARFFTDSSPFRTSSLCASSSNSLGSMEIGYARTHLMISEVDHTFPLVRLNPKHLLRRPDEVAGVTLGVKGYDIGLEKASQGAFTHVTWQDTPRLG